jgi:hypothetical protein
MPEFPASTLAPARVHARARELVGHQPCWIRPPYESGLFSISHFRICSYCRCIHPGDMIELLREGRSRLEHAAKAEKFFFVTPNPIAGELVPMGSMPGPIFEGSLDFFPPSRRFASPLKSNLAFTPTPAERLAGHFERPALEAAPDLIRWPFYVEHTSERQWPEIEAAASQGEEHASLPSA